mgnify:CR=1 FL=1
MGMRYLLKVSDTFARCNLSVMVFETILERSITTQRT